jgi:hypothetical protein
LFFGILVARRHREEKESEEKIEAAVQLGHGTSHLHHAEHLIACAYALMGNGDKAVEWLQKSITVFRAIPCSIKIQILGA